MKTHQEQTRKKKNFKKGGYLNLFSLNFHFKKLKTVSKQAQSFLVFKILLVCSRKKKCLQNNIT